MVNAGVWRNGIYDSIECDDPNVFYTLLGQHFKRRTVAEAIHAFSQLALVVKYPLDLLRVTAQVFNKLLLKPIIISIIVSSVLFALDYH